MLPEQTAQGRAVVLTPPSEAFAAKPGETSQQRDERICNPDPYYLFVSMRRVYGQGPWLTFAKLAVLSFTYVFCAAIALAVTGAYSIFAA